MSTALNRPRILVVEDEVIVAMDIAMQLRELGFEPVGHATRGEQAIELPGQYGDKIEHALAFFVLAALAGIGHAGSALASRLMIALIGYGLLIECIQWCIPWREFSLLDWAADAMGVLCWLLLAWLRRRVMR